MIELAPKIRQEDMESAIKLLVDSKLQHLFEKISNEYLYWDKIKYQVPNDIDGKIFWHAVKLQRSFNAKTVSFGRYNFHFTITERMLALLHEFDMNLGGSLGTQSIIPERDKNFYLVSSIMEEAIASSQMEGASTTRRIAKDMLRKQQKPQNKSQQMISNNYATIRYLAERQQDELSIDKLQEIHKSIASKTLDDSEDEGRLRTDDNIMVMDGITGEVAHTPPSHTEVPTLLAELCDFANHDNKDDFIHPIIKGIIIHFMLAYIHPYVDGNGRTARSLVYWYLIKRAIGLLNIYRYHVSSTEIKRNMKRFFCIQKMMATICLISYNSILKR